MRRQTGGNGKNARGKQGFSSQDTRKLRGAAKKNRKRDSVQVRHIPQPVIKSNRERGRSRTRNKIAAQGGEDLMEKETQEGFLSCAT